MTAMFILNPYANRWKAGRRKDEALAALRSSGVAAELRLTERPGHATELAHRAVLQGFSPIIAAGGDGSISEVVNGVVRAADETGDDVVPVGLLPLGSANDLIDNLHLPRDLKAAADVIGAGCTRRIDLGRVAGRYFDNNSALGLEPTISVIQQRMRRLHGTPRYVVATLRGVMLNPGWTMDLEWDDGRYEGPVTVVTVGNCARTGGVFYGTPHADPFDGRLTVTYSAIRSRAELIRVLPRTTKQGAGSWVEHPLVHEFHATWLRVRSTRPTPMHADGEVQSTGMTELEYRVVPARLPVLVP